MNCKLPPTAMQRSFMAPPSRGHDILNVVGSIIETAGIGHAALSIIGAVSAAASSRSAAAPLVDMTGAAALAPTSTY